MMDRVKTFVNRRMMHCRTLCTTVRACLRTLEWQRIVLYAGVAADVPGTIGAYSRRSLVMIVDNGLIGHDAKHHAVSNVSMILQLRHDNANHVFLRVHPEPGTKCAPQPNVPSDNGSSATLWSVSTENPRPKP